MAGSSIFSLTLSQDGQTFTGEENGADGVLGPWPYGSEPAFSFSGLTLSAKKIEVKRSLLP
jgi:hypothetical protein